VAFFICSLSPRAIISWYPFQIMNKKHTNPIANRRYLFTRNIISVSFVVPVTISGDIWSESLGLSLGKNTCMAFVNEINHDNVKDARHIDIFFHISSWAYRLKIIFYDNNV